MELSHFWKAIRKNLWIVTLVVLAGLASAIYYTLSIPARYESSTVLLLNPGVPGTYVPYVQTTEVAARLADNYTQYMRTRSFGESVVKQLRFPMAPEDVAPAISTHLEPNTLFYKIIGTMPNPDQAQQLTGTVAQEFLSSYASGQQPGRSNGTLQSQMAQRLTGNLQSLDDQIKSYTSQIADLEKQSPSTDRDAQLLQLRGQLVTLEASESSTMVALAQIGDQGNTASTALVIDQALPGTPVPDQLLRNLGVALLVSLLIGVGIALLRDYLDYSIRSPEYLEETLGAAPVAAIGVIGASKADARDNDSAHAAQRLLGKGLVTLERPASTESESFRVLRTNILFTSLEKPIRSLVVTSAARGEGKSFTAANLAIVMAQAGNRVILVDADLRNPDLHTVFGLSNQEGFTNLVLSGSIRSEKAIQPVLGVENLAVITSGPLPPDPSELLNSDHAARVMEELAQAADFVVYDSPPVGVATDPAAIGARAGATILVVGAGATRKDMVVHARDALLKAGVRTVLPVLNRVKAGKLPGYYYYTDSDSRQLVSNGRGPSGDGRFVDGVVETADDEKSEIRSQKSESIV